MSNRDNEKVKMRLLLESWGFGDMVNHLEANDVDMECLPGLDDGMIAELFPSIGKRSKFRMCLRHYLETCDLPEVAEASKTIDRNEPFQVLDSSELALPNDMCGEYVMENEASFQEPTEDPLKDPILAAIACKLQGTEKQKRKKSVLSFPTSLPVLSPFLEHHRLQGTLKTQRRAFVNECCNHLILLTKGTPTSGDYLAYSCSIVQKYKEFRDANSVNPAESFQHSLSRMIRNRRTQARKKFRMELPEVLGFKSTSAQSDKVVISKVLQSESSSLIKNDEKKIATHETNLKLNNVVPIAVEKLIKKPLKSQSMFQLAVTGSAPSAPLPDSAVESCQSVRTNTALILKAPQSEPSMAIDDAERIRIHNAMKKSKRVVLVELEKSHSYATTATQTAEKPAEDPSIKKILETVTLLLAGHQETKIFIEMQLKKIQEQANLIDELKTENEQLKQKQKLEEQIRKRQKYR